MIDKSTINRFLQPFLLEVREKNLVPNEFYNWDLADGEIIETIVKTFDQLLETSEEARKNYIEVMPRGCFQFDLVELRTFFQETLSNRFYSLCFGVNEKFLDDNLDIFGDGPIDDLESELCDVFVVIVNFLSMRQIQEMNVLHADLTKLIGKYTAI